MATAPGDMPVVLVGHSMGGMTVMALADQHPELFGTKVIGAALLSTAASTVDPATWLPAPLRPAVRVAMPSMMTGASKGRMAEWSSAAGSRPATSRSSAPGGSGSATRR